MDASRPLALVTGASSGIGLELARQFAGHGFDLVIAARHEDLLDAAEMLRRTGAEVEAVRVDLATAAGVERLYERVRAADRPLAAAAINAGVAAGGGFATETALADELELIDLNVRGTVHLAKRVAADMVARGAGRILITSSIAANTPGAFHAVYNASKSFVQSFALALRNELRYTGVTVTALMPGPSETALFAKAGMLDTRVGAGRKDCPADVARIGFEALLAGAERATASSPFTRLEAVASRFLPDRVKAELHRRMAEPGSAKS
jgi:short-subunit dehydrogenase